VTETTKLPEAEEPPSPDEVTNNGVEENGDPAPSAEDGNPQAPAEGPVPPPVESTNIGGQTEGGPAVLVKATWDRAIKREVRREARRAATSEAARKRSRLRRAQQVIDQIKKEGREPEDPEYVAWVEKKIDELGLSFKTGKLKAAAEKKLAEKAENAKPKKPLFAHADVSRLEASAYARLFDRVRAAREDLGAFIEFAFRDPKGRPLELAPFHREWAALFAKEPRVFIEASRSHGKTTQVIAFCLWRLGRNPNTKIKYVCQNDSRAKERLYELRVNLENNPAVKMVFPRLKPANLGDWTKTRLVVERSQKFKDPSFEALGILSSAVGGRIDLIVADDIVDLRNSILYPSLREAVKQKFFGELLPALEPPQEGGQAVAIGSPWSQNDLYSILRQNPEWKYVRYAVGDAEDPFAPLWPARWPREALIKIRQEIGALEFNRAFRCEALSGEATPCRPEWIRYYDKDLLGDPNKLVCIQAYDLAISQATSADYFACVTVLYNADKNLIFIADAWHDRLSFADQARAIINEAGRWRPERIVVERVGLGGGLYDYLRSNSQTPLPIVPYRPRGDKQRRFMEISPHIEDGRVYFHPNLDPQRNVLVAERGDIVTEFLEFPLGKNDDLLDAAVMAIDELRNFQLDEPGEGWLEGDGIRARFSVV
jgi:phage terminase large subunit-like protein